MYSLFILLLFIFLHNYESKQKTKGNQTECKEDLIFISNTLQTSLSEKNLVA